MTQTIAQTVPAALRRELGDRALSMAGLARNLGETANWVTRRLREETEITLTDLVEMCRGLELEAVVEFRPAPAPKKKTTAGRGAGRRSRTQPPSGEGSEQ